MESLKSNADDAYFFQRDHRSSIRMNYQHWMIRHVCGYLLNPAIPTESPTLRIADIGAATCILPIELAGDLSHTVRIDCFDISADQYPPKDLIPKNIHLYVHDAFTPFPEEFQDQYDIVNIRFFAPVMNSSKVSPLLQNFLKITKPGGYIQWFEPDMAFTKAYAPTPAVPTSATQKLTGIMRHPTGDNDFEWVPKLDSIFASEGLEVIINKRHSVPDSYKVFTGQAQLMAFEDMMSKMEADGKTEQAQQMRFLYTALLEEYRQGALVDVDFLCVVGKKAL